MLRLKESSEVIAKKVQFMNSASERSRGLLIYESAPNSFAAVFRLPLFGFLPVIHTFGMKFEIDIAFCDSQKRVQYFRPQVQKNKLVAPARYLLGGLPYVVEFSKCDTSMIRESESILDWEDLRAS